MSNEEIPYVSLILDVGNHKLHSPHGNILSISIKNLFQFVNLCFQDLFRSSRKFMYHVSTLVKLECRHSTDSTCRSNIIRLINVYLYKNDIRIFFCHLFKNWCDLLKSRKWLLEKIWKVMHTHTKIQTKSTEHRWMFYGKRHGHSIHMHTRKNKVDFLSYKSAWWTPTNIRRRSYYC